METVGRARERKSGVRSGQLDVMDVLKNCKNIKNTNITEKKQSASLRLTNVVIPYV